MVAMNALPVKTRLVLGFGFSVLLMIILTVVGVINVNKINHTLTVITDINSVKQRYAINFRGSVHDRAIAIRDVAMSLDWSDTGALRKEIDDLAAFYEDSHQKMQQMQREDIEFTSAERRMLDNIDQIRARTLPIVEQILRAKQSGETARVTALTLQEVRPAFIDWLDAINEFIDYQESENQRLTPQAVETASSFQTLMILLTAIAAILGIVIAIWIANSILCSIGGEPDLARKSLQAAASGDLGAVTHTSHPNSLMAAQKNMQEKLKAIVSHISQDSNRVNIQADTVAAGSSQVIEAVKQQMDIIDETVDNLMSMEENLLRSSEKAGKNRENAKLMTERADSGKAQVTDTANIMEQIAERMANTVTQVESLASLVEEIGDITNVIHNISDQTNLLALNAAIEAARAGDSGRGFAVVAQEVRELAMRTSTATSEIEDKIGRVQQESKISVAAMNASLPEVEKGRDKTREAAETLSEISNQAANTLNNSTVVQSNAQEQSQTIRLISTSMEDVQKMGLDSLASMQANHEAAHQLQGVSSDLQEQMSFFKI